MNREPLETGDQREDPPAKGFAGNALLAAAFFTCPCHLPVYSVLFGGTALGAYLAEYVWFSAAVLTVVFLFSFLAGMRMIKAGEAT